MLSYRLIASEMIRKRVESVPLSDMDRNQMYNCKNVELSL